jgi:hypothetical protein
MRHPMIFLDLDGTLVGPSGDVAPEVWVGLEAARARGQRLSVCTGRPSGGVASRVARRLDPDAPHVFYGGALVARAGAALHVDPVPEPDARALLAIAAALDPARVALEVYTPDRVLLAADSAHSRRHARGIGVEVDVLSAPDLDAVLSSTPIVKLQWVTPDGPLADDLATRAPQTCFSAAAGSPAFPDLHFVTVTARGVDKGSAVRRAAAALGFAPSECAAVGDSYNDLPMLEVVGHPFVMGNAEPELRARYPNLPPVTAHGVLSALDL